MPQPPRSVQHQATGAPRAKKRRGNGRSQSRDHRVFVIESLDFDATFAVTWFPAPSCLRLGDTGPAEFPLQRPGLVLSGQLMHSFGQHRKSHLQINSDVS